MDRSWNNKQKVVHLVNIVETKGKRGLRGLIRCLEVEETHIGHAELAETLKEGNITCTILREMWFVDCSCTHSPAAYAKVLHGTEDHSTSSKLKQAFTLAAKPLQHYNVFAYSVILLMYKL